MVLFKLKFQFFRHRSCCKAIAANWCC